MEKSLKFDKSDFSIEMVFNAESRNLAQQSAEEKLFLQENTLIITLSNVLSGASSSYTSSYSLSDQPLKVRRLATDPIMTRTTDSRHYLQNNLPESYTVGYFNVGTYAPYDALSLTSNSNTLNNYICSDSTILG